MNDRTTRATESNALLILWKIINSCIWPRISRVLDDLKTVYRRLSKQISEAIKEYLSIQSPGPLSRSVIAAVGSGTESAFRVLYGFLFRQQRFDFTKPTQHRINENIDLLFRHHRRKRARTGIDHHDAVIKQVI